MIKTPQSAPWTITHQSGWLLKDSYALGDENPGKDMLTVSPNATGISGVKKIDNSIGALTLAGA
jgi:hypothetical protein